MLRRRALSHFAKSKVQKPITTSATKESGRLCAQKLPPLQPGKIRRVDMYAAANFWGYTDESPSVEDMVSITCVREVLAAGVVQLALREAAK